MGSWPGGISAARRSATSGGYGSDSGSIRGVTWQASSPNDLHAGRRSSRRLQDCPSTSRPAAQRVTADRKSTRLNSSHANISYAVFCLKKKKKLKIPTLERYTYPRVVQYRTDAGI